MNRLKTNGNFITKINQKHFEEAQNLNMKYNKKGQLSINKNINYKIVSLSQYRNKFQEKYISKNSTKRSRGVNEIKNYEKEKVKVKDKSQKINNLLKKQKKKEKKINSSNNLIKDLFKNNLFRENDLNKNNKQEYNEFYSKVDVNKKKEKDIDKDYNGGEKILKKMGEREKNLIISKINKDKRINYYENTNSRERIKIRINNKDKTFTERNQKRIKNEGNIMNYCSFNKINEIQFESKLKIKHRNKKVENNKDNTFEYPENGGISNFNKSNNIIKSQNNEDLKVNINNLKNEYLNTKNKRLNKVNHDSYMKTFDKKNQNEKKTISPMLNSKKKLSKIKTYKKINLTLCQNILLNNPQFEKTFILTTNSSRNKISYNERLEQKKKLLGIYLKCKEYKMIKKKLEDDLNNRNIKKNYVFVYKKNEEENNTVRIYDEKNNSIKMMRKRSRISHKYKRNLEFQYDNELYKKSQDKLETINNEKIRNIYEKIGFSAMPKGLELMRKLTEM